MKKLILVVSTGSAAAMALARKVSETVGEIRDLAEMGPRSIDALQYDASVEQMQIMQYEAQTDDVDPCPACERSIQFAVAQSDRIRSILGPRNDDSRTVVDLIDELCEDLDKNRKPTKICPACYLFNGAEAEDCRECGEVLK